MKHYLSTVLALACAVLVISLIVMKRGDSAQHESDAGAIADYSNRLDSAQLDLSTCHGTAIILSNSLNECQSAALAFSNRLTEAESAVAFDAEQITNLNRQVASAESENQTLNRQVADLTNQMAGLTQQITSTQASLVQTNTALVQAYKDYGLLENRLRRDVAERMIVERRFYNSWALQDQLEELKQNPGRVISAERIYAGLDVEVNSNGTFHVLSPE